MVMGPTHSMSGAAAGLAMASVLPASWGGPETVPQALVFAGITAGAALLPDLDLPGSTLARSFGPVSDLLSRVVENLSQAFYNLTRTSKDEPANHGHRTATHTLWFAIAVGVGTAGLVSAFGQTAVVALLFLLLGFALRGLAPQWAKKKGWLVVTGLSAAAALAVWVAVPQAASGIALGMAVFVGVVVHDIGDWLTKQGVPFLGGVVTIKGKRWWDFAPPSVLRIRAGGFADQLLLTACTGAVIALAYFLVAEPATVGAAWASGA